MIAEAAGAIIRFPRHKSAVPACWTEHPLKASLGGPQTLFCVSRELDAVCLNAASFRISKPESLGPSRRSHGGRALNPRVEISAQELGYAPPCVFWRDVVPTRPALCASR